jgi:hypothetical protein
MGNFYPNLIFVSYADGHKPTLVGSGRTPAQLANKKVDLKHTRLFKQSTSAVIKYSVVNAIIG